MNNVRVAFQFHLGRSQTGIVLREGPAPEKPPPGSIPRVARLVALAHKFEGLLKAGTVRNMAELARLGRVTRARITQIMDLLLLAPDIREDLLFLPPIAAGYAPVTLRTLRYVCQSPVWAEQRRRWAEIKGTLLRSESSYDDVSAGESPVQPK